MSWHLSMPDSVKSRHYNPACVDYYHLMASPPHIFGPDLLQYLPLTTILFFSRLILSLLRFVQLLFFTRLAHSMSGTESRDPPTIASSSEAKDTEHEETEHT